jgi:hypothetical protein
MIVNNMVTRRSRSFSLSKASKTAWSIATDVEVHDMRKVALQLQVAQESAVAAPAGQAGI